ncbi:PH domain-containing protein [Staphylococcus gallinarum]|uniref:PH domain-containing protein n=1 Tax=Staphylococcus gallinarum TaxID=1293 RepID=UPI002DBB9405|nr:PH domain-containing protein [Staphylococcus gallinarum]MEB6238601.1 PH domain-containing protein [Staphylococcus gallinarum]
MNQYKHMAEASKQAIRLNFGIWFCIFIVISIALFIVNKWWLSWVTVKVSIIILVFMLIISVLFFIYGVVFLPLIYYKIFEYKIDNETVTIKKGLWFRKRYAIPLFRIQNVDTHRGMIMRKYNLATLTLSTAGGNKEIKLIDIQEADKIKAMIKQQHNMNSEIQ